MSALAVAIAGGGAGFDPLPGLAQGGALFDPARDERWRQVSDGTVPAGPGDPVGWAQDLTAGKLLTQSVTANRPTRVLNDGVWGLELDGENDRLEGDAAMRDIFRNAPGASIACVVEPLSLGAIGVIAKWSRLQSGAGARFSLEHGALGEVIIRYRRLDLDSGAVLNSGSSLVLGQKTLLVVRLNYADGGANALTVRSGGVQTTAATVAGSGNTSDTASFAMRLGARGDDVQFANMRLHGPIVIWPGTNDQPVWSDAQVQAIESRLSGITGAPLS